MCRPIGQIMIRNSVACGGEGCCLRNWLTSERSDLAPMQGLARVLTIRDPKVPGQGRGTNEAWPTCRVRQAHAVSLTVLASAFKNPSGSIWGEASSSGLRNRGFDHAGVVSLFVVLALGCQRVDLQGRVGGLAY